MRKSPDLKARDRTVPISGSFGLTPLCNLDGRVLNEYDVDESSPPVWTRC